MAHLVAINLLFMASGLSAGIVLGWVIFSPVKKRRK